MGKMLFFLVAVVGLYFGMQFINQVKTFSTIGATPKDIVTIDVSGDGESYAIPDVATINFTVEAKGKTVVDTQSLVTVRVNQAIDFLKSSGIDSKDIQTTNYVSSPEYNNPCNGGYGMPCSSKDLPKIIGYDVGQSVSVKIRKTEISGKIIDGLGKIGVSGMSGPNFSVDNPDAVQALAKQKAIDNAKEKASVLAKQLGVHLGKIVRFNENGNSPVPMMYSAKADMAVGSGSTSSGTSLPAGQSKYVSNVVIGYEIY